jgi:hypothetical protein
MARQAAQRCKQKDIGKQRIALYSVFPLGVPSMLKTRNHFKPFLLPWRTCHSLLPASLNTQSQMHSQKDRPCSIGLAKTCITGQNKLVGLIAKQSRNAHYHTGV